MNHTKVFDFIQSRIKKTTTIPVQVTPNANVSIFLRIGWLNLLLLNFKVASAFIFRLTQILFKILWSFFFSTFFLIFRTIPEMQVIRKVTDTNTGQNIWTNGSVSIHSPEKIIISTCKLHKWYIPNADTVANPKLATKRKWPKKWSSIPPMYLNFVAIAALIAIASVKHKVTQIGTTDPTKIVISANLKIRVRPLN